MTDKHQRRRKNKARNSSIPGNNGKAASQAKPKSTFPDLNDAQVRLLAWLVEHPGADQQTAGIDLAMSDVAAVAAALQDIGLLVIDQQQHWSLADQVELLTGRVSLHPDGFGFVATAQQDEDVYLSGREMRGLMPGDSVLVRQHMDNRKQRQYGELLGIVERAKQSVVGRIVQSGKRLELMPDDPTLSEAFRIASDQQQAFAPGSMVIGRITRYPQGGRAGRVVIERELDDQHLAGMATEIAILEHDLPTEFAPETLAEAERFGDRIPTASSEGREDLRDYPLVTIDGADARDFDDAVLGEKTTNGWRLVVAIADVASYVTPGSSLDSDAIERGTSVYFPTRVAPMLPEALSNGLCSLKPDEDRLALVCDMQLSNAGQIHQSRFYPAVIRSHARLTYSQANTVLEQRQAIDGMSAAVLDSLLALEKIWQLRDQVKAQRGALAFDREEAQFIWNEDGTVKDIQTRPRLVTHRLIEEAMIAANVEAARLLLKQNFRSILRVHPPPGGDKLAELERMLLVHNIKPAWHESPTPADFARILEQAKDRPDSGIISEMLLRAQSLAVYAATEDGETGGHFGLALEAYSHFTSPIRRYPDLMVHRALYRAMGKVPGQTANRSSKKSAYDQAGKLTELAQHCSFTERRAERASRDVEFRLKCHYLQAFEGQVFHGWVTGIKNFGLFVELEKLQISGLLHVSNLGKDYYVFDERNQCLYNRRTGQRFNLGDELNVKLLRVDLETRKIDFALE